MTAEPARHPCKHTFSTSLERRIPMKLSQTLLPEFDQEMATTRKLLERVPEGRADWKPHDKSMSLGRLATHVAELVGWGPTILGQESLDLAPPGGGGYQPRTLDSGQAIV